MASAALAAVVAPAASANTGSVTNFTCTSLTFNCDNDFPSGTNNMTETVTFNGTVVGSGSVSLPGPGPSPNYTISIVIPAGTTTATLTADAVYTTSTASRPSGSPTASGAPDPSSSSPSSNRSPGYHDRLREALGDMPSVEFEELHALRFRAMAR